MRIRRHAIPKGHRFHHRRVPEMGDLDDPAAEIRRACAGRYDAGHEPVTRPWTTKSLPTSVTAKSQRAIEDKSFQPPPGILAASPCSASHQRVYPPYSDEIGGLRDRDGRCPATNRCTWQPQRFAPLWRRPGVELADREVSWNLQRQEADFWYLGWYRLANCGGLIALAFLDPATHPGGLRRIAKRIMLAIQWLWRKASTFLPCCQQNEPRLGDNQCLLSVASLLQRVVVFREAALRYGIEHADRTITMSRAISSVSRGSRSNSRAALLNELRVAWRAKPRTCT